MKFVKWRMDFSQLKTIIVYLDCIILIGINKRPEIYMHWERDYGIILGST